MIRCGCGNCGGCSEVNGELTNHGHTAYPANSMTVGRQSTVGLAPSSAIPTTAEPGQRLNCYLNPIANANDFLVGGDSQREHECAHCQYGTLIQATATSGGTTMLAKPLWKTPRLTVTLVMIQANLGAAYGHNPPVSSCKPALHPGFLILGS